MSLGSRDDYWGGLLAERLSNWLWASEASCFIDRDPAESFREDGAASLCIDVVICFKAEEEGAKVRTLGLQL